MDPNKLALLDELASLLDLRTEQIARFREVFGELIGMDLTPQNFRLVRVQDQRIGPAVMPPEYSGMGPPIRSFPPRESTPIQLPQPRAITSQTREDTPFALPLLWEEVIKVETKDTGKGNVQDIIKKLEVIERSDEARAINAMSKEQIGALYANQLYQFFTALPGTRTFKASGVYESREGLTTDRATALDILCRLALVMALEQVVPPENPTLVQASILFSSDWEEGVWDQIYADIPGLDVVYGCNTYSMFCGRLLDEMRSFVNSFFLRVGKASSLVPADPTRLLTDIVIDANTNGDAVNRKGAIAAVNSLDWGKFVQAGPKLDISTTTYSRIVAERWFSTDGTLRGVDYPDTSADGIIQGAALAAWIWSAYRGIMSDIGPARTIKTTESKSTGVEAGVSVGVLNAKYSKTKTKTNEGER